MKIWCIHFSRTRKQIDLLGHRECQSAFANGICLTNIKIMVDGNWAETADDASHETRLTASQARNDGYTHLESSDPSHITFAVKRRVMQLGPACVILTARRLHGESAHPGQRCSLGFLIPVWLWNYYSSFKRSSLPKPEDYYQALVFHLTIFHGCLDWRFRLKRY